VNFHFYEIPLVFVRRISRSALVAYNYFDFKDAAKRNIQGLLALLLLQLVDDSDRCWDFKDGKLLIVMRIGECALPVS
jgi:hypothetical protein